MRETAGKWEMRKFRRNEFLLCESAGSVRVSDFLLHAIRFPGGFLFFSNCLCSVIVIIMPGCGCYGLALVKPESDLEDLLYECKHTLPLV